MLALALGLVLLALGVAAAAPQPAGAATFENRPAPLADGRLFDLGVSDYDRDGNLELFSVNHKFLGTLAESGPGGTWSDRMAEARFGPTPDYPGFEDLLHPPRITEPGLYIYAESRTGGESGHDETPRIHIVAEDVEGIPLLPEDARGKLTLPSPYVEVARRSGANVTVSREGKPTNTVVRFRVAERGHIVLRVKKVDLPPIRVQIDEAPLLAQTFVGARKVRALDSSFTLELVDRHGIAFTSSDGDGRSDAYIARGGLGGGIAQFIGRVTDELLRQGPAGEFSDRIGSSKLRKGGCRSRQVATVDYDGDGRLDLFSSCKGGTPKLYRRIDTRYAGRSRPLKRVGAEGSNYRWVDVAGDSRPELLVAGKRSVKVLKLKGKRWKRAQKVETRNLGRIVHSMAVGDPDGDGDPDVFVGAPSGNTLLVNRRGRLIGRSPGRLGLPRRGSSGVAWVDYDNDGRLDLHSLPQGLFRQRGGGRFFATGKAGGPRKIGWGIASWPDYDNDGYRDLAAAMRTTAGKPGVRTRLARNDLDGNHWLQLDLRGRDANAEAVGAEVRVKSDGRLQSARVGESESSRYSQAHYRVYFGLRKAQTVDKIAIRWPDGGRTRLKNIPADQRLTIAR